MLPKQSTPIYNTVIPSTGKTVEFRPFLVKDKKNLLMAQISNDPKVMVSTLKDIIKNCLIEDIDINKLATFDIEKLFCIIRAKSDGEIVNLSINCRECENKTQISFDVTKVDVKFQEGHLKKFILFDNVGVCMKYPTYESVLNSNNITSVDDVIGMIVDSIDYIYDDKKLYPSKDSTRGELIEFVENLTEEQLNKMKNFFSTMPKFSHTLHFKCPHCSNEEHLEIDGIHNFF